MVYYFAAAICLPLGYGHLRLRRWALTLTRLFLSLWLGAGLILGANLALLAPTALRLDQPRGVLYGRLVQVSVGVFFSFIMLPLLGLWFYRRDLVRKIFESHDPNQYWTERYPTPVLAIALMLGFLILALHIAIFTQALFPLFGTFLMGRSSVYIISASIMLLGVLMFGVLRRETWAWWGTVAFLGFLTVSTIMTFSRYSLSEIIWMMDLPAYERAFLSEFQILQDLKLVGFIGAPLFAVIGLVLYSKQHFKN